MRKNIFLVIAFILAISIFIAALWVDRSNTDTTSTSVTSDQPVSAIECYADEDCLRAGCSQQLCLPRDQASGTFTTCEWKDEYACYDYADCICIHNKCSWSSGQEFNDCFQKLE